MWVEEKILAYNYLLGQCKTDNLFVRYVSLICFGKLLLFYENHFTLHSSAATFNYFVSRYQVVA